MGNTLKNTDMEQELNPGHDVAELAATLVRIPSCSETFSRENAMAMHIHSIFQAEGISSELIEVEENHFNVTATIKGTGEGKSLMLCGHLDTVPAYDMEDHLSGSIIDGRLYGRGSCDMKGALAAMIYAIIDIKRSGVQLKGDLVFAGVIEEEIGGKGIGHIAKHGPFVDGAVIGEPTDMRVALGHKGLEWIKIDVKGKKVHGGKMDKGVNAIVMAGILVEKIHREYTQVLRGRSHPILGSPTINIGRIFGGDQPSTVPGTCTIEIDRRWIPEETLDQVYQELESLIDNIRSEEPRFSATVRSYKEPNEIPPHRPFCTEATDPLASKAMKVLGRLGIVEIKPTDFPAWSDAGVLADLTEARCIIVGPGDLELAHTAEESIAVEDLEVARCFYRELAVDYCGLEE
ncbi:M20 family metallopeptidase [Gudongella sp. SC589]|jgi:acetylornithine deacetylase/succinyl-diaminopimelate desuccinylase|uniref:M20 family metallopeptidase n=1 Tax=Gudongella sp. SC589 TaxID=3385990 RepID=UPI003904C8C5